MTKVNKSMILWNLVYMFYVLTLIDGIEEFDNLFYNLRYKYKAKEGWGNRVVAFTRCQ